MTSEQAKELVSVIEGELQNFMEDGERELGFEHIEKSDYGRYNIEHSSSFRGEYYFQKVDFEPEKTDKLIFLRASKMLMSDNFTYIYLKTSISDIDNPSVSKEILDAGYLKVSKSGLAQFANIIEQAIQITL